jgi:Flp pilus assembly protein TadG
MNIRARARGEEGAAAVEFALIVGVLAMLIFGMLQFGLAFFQLQNLRAATREGARIGAVDAPVVDPVDPTNGITGRVQQASGISAPFGNSLVVQRVMSGVPTTVTGSTRPCADVNDVTPDSVVVGIDLTSSSLPQGLQNIFTVDIPLLPTIDLRNSQVVGEFRCES